MDAIIVIKHPSSAGTMEQVVQEETKEVVRKVNQVTAKKGQFIVVTGEDGKQYSAEAAEVEGIRDA